MSGRAEARMKAPGSEAAAERPGAPCRSEDAVPAEAVPTRAESRSLGHDEGR